MFQINGTGDLTCKPLPYYWICLPPSMSPGV